MIEVSWQSHLGLLQVKGHAQDLVCAGVALITGTLFANYGAEEPQDGKFQVVVDANDTKHKNVIEFALNCLKTLQTKFPDQVVIREF